MLHDTPNVGRLPTGRHPYFGLIQS